MQRLQPLRHAGIGIDGDHAVGDMAQPVALLHDHPPAGEAQARIDADHPDHTARAFIYSSWPDSLDPAIHDFPSAEKTWMPGSSPGMTVRSLRLLVSVSDSCRWRVTPTA